MELGEIYALGNHRLMCGDATKKEDVLKLVGNERVNLVLTDPPYGIKIINPIHKSMGQRKTERTYFNNCETFRKDIRYSPIHGDDSTNSARENYYIIRDLCDSLIIWGGQYFTDFLPVNGGWIFWDKLRPNTLDFGSGELAYNTCSNAVKKYAHKWNGAIREGSKDLNPQPILHPTQKPVELHMSILQDFSREWDTVLDCFAGSGTTLIACEMTGRKCLTMEISPEYCEIICNRFEKLTGIQPVKL